MCVCVCSRLCWDARWQNPRCSFFNPFSKFDNYVQPYMHTSRSNISLCYINPISKNNNSTHKRTHEKEICAKWFAIVLWLQDKNVKYHWNCSRWRSDLVYLQNSRMMCSDDSMKGKLREYVYIEVVEKKIIISHRSQFSFVSFYSPHLFNFNCGKFIVRIALAIIIAAWMWCGVTEEHSTGLFYREICCLLEWNAFICDVVLNASIFSHNFFHFLHAIVSARMASEANIRKHIGMLWKRRR